LALNSDQDIIDSIDYSSSKLSYYEPLIKAAFLMAPAYGSAFDRGGLKSIQTPVMIVAGGSDQVVPVEENAKYFAKEISTSSLKILSGRVGHFVFLNEITKEGKKAIRKELHEDDPTVSRHNIHEQVSKLARDFFKQMRK
jgi:predicted dienelactone hydrolase